MASKDLQDFNMTYSAFSGIAESDGRVFKPGSTQTILGIVPQDSLLKTHQTQTMQLNEAKKRSSLKQSQSGDSIDSPSFANAKHSLVTS